MQVVGIGRHDDIVTVRYDRRRVLRKQPGVFGRLPVAEVALIVQPDRYHFGRLCGREQANLRELDRGPRPLGRGEQVPIQHVDGLALEHTVEIAPLVRIPHVPGDTVLGYGGAGGKEYGYRTQYHCGRSHDGLLA